jgi:tRNA pseudouridine55 synthase
MLLTRDTLNEYERWTEAARETGAVALIDKERGWTSFDVVAKLRGITRIKKIGHAGTLDPLATGLLIVCLGKMTKSIESFQAQRKAYRAVIKLGATTATDDAEAAEENITSVAHLTNHDIAASVQAFVGEIQQVPPMFSALKQNGVPLYKMARKGRTVERPARTVSIYNISVCSLELPFVTLDVECSKGTYIRSLARDIGERLGTGAYLYGLRRTAIGEYLVEHAVTLADIRQAAAATEMLAERTTAHAPSLTIVENPS